jgi:hypothetical protein
MALDHLIEKARAQFSITDVEQWCNVRPEWILQVDGCGQATLDHIRLYLAARGLTLRDDRTPWHWQEHLESAKIGAKMAERDLARVEAFTILIDTQEKHPFTFQGFLDGDKPIIVPSRFQSLGASHGDYSVAGLEGDAHVERKSQEDAHGTFLSHGDRRDRWERTLEFMAGIPCAAIVIECSLGTLLNTVEVRGGRNERTLRRTLHRQILAWEQDYRIPFVFCDNRGLAEATTLAILKRRWQKVNGLKKNRKDEKKSRTDVVKENLTIIASL